MNPFDHIATAVPLSDWLSLLLAATAIGLAITVAEIARRHFRRSSEFTRKWVHVAVGLMMFFIPLFFRSGLPLLVIGVLAVLFTFITIKYDLFRGINNQRDSYGLVYYCLSFVILLLLTWPDQVFYSGGSHAGYGSCRRGSGFGRTITKKHPGATVLFVITSRWKDR